MRRKTFRKPNAPKPPNKDVKDSFRSSLEVYWPRGENPERKISECKEIAHSATAWKYIKRTVQYV